MCACDPGRGCVFRVLLDGPSAGKALKCKASRVAGFICRVHDEAKACWFRIADTLLSPAVLGTLVSILGEELRR